MISIIKAPYTYQPSGNDSIFQLESDNPNILSFNVKILEASSGGVIFNGNYYVRPDHTTGVSFNLSSILSNLVQVKVTNLNTIAEAVSGSTLSYRLVINERIVVNGLTQDGATYNNGNDRYTIWDAKIDRLLFKAFNPDDYVVTGNLLPKFLDVKPSISTQSFTSNEQLYFINTSFIAKQVRIRLFNAVGNQINQVLSNIPDGLMIRLNVSPKALGVDFNGVKEYRVDLIAGNGAAVTETKTYKVVNDLCHLQPVNILFTNSLGGVTTHVFFNPIESINTTKTTLKSNILQLNSGVYSDSSNGILNSSERIINTTSTSSYTVFSNPLNDAETQYLSELISSENVYVESGSTLIPIAIKNSNYQVALRKTNGGKINRLEIQYSTNY